MPQSNDEIIRGWSGAAPFWEKHRDIIRRMFAPVTDALVEDARIGNGHTVLDIATGPGEPALTLAALVGPEGKVIGIDPVPGMIAAARRRRTVSNSGRNLMLPSRTISRSRPIPSMPWSAASV